MTAGDESGSLEAIYDDPFRFHGFIHNHMVKMLSLTAAEMTEGMLTRVDFGQHRVDTAKRNLASFDLIGVQERFGEFWHDVNRRFGWTLGSTARSNETTPVDVPDTFRARIAEDNSLDVDLYNHALMLHARAAERWQPAPIP
jgi:hypothetical protein